MPFSLTKVYLRERIRNFTKRGETFMKVLFVYPEGAKSGYKPYGVSLLISLLKQNKHEVKLFETSVYDFGYKKDHEVTASYALFKKANVPEYGKKVNENVDSAFKRTLEEFRPDVLAVTMTYLTKEIAVRLLDNIDGKNFPVIAGGIHCTLCPEDAISHRNIDVICQGEGEEALIDFINAVEKGEDYSQIKNLWVKKEDGSIVQNELRSFYKNLDNLPFVDWSFFGENYFWRPFMGKSYRWGEFMTSRGCLNTCSYCFYNEYYNLYHVKKRSVAWMTPERVIKELEYLVKTYNLQFLKFIDSDFSARDIDSLAKISELYSKKIKLPFVFQGYARNMSKEKVKLLKNMNCVSIAVGLESGSPRVRREILNRSMKDETFLNAIKNIQKAGIRATSLNMIGIPTETREDIFKTIKLNKKAKVSVADVTFLYPFPKTRIRTFAEEHKLIKEEKTNINFREESIYDMPQISSRELKGIMKNFPIYVNFPKWTYPIIKIAEADNAMGKSLHKILSKVYYFNKYVLH
jgi:radical SAM superfamily enzyme YgiQ (UPF0313 family)